MQFDLGAIECSSAQEKAYLLSVLSFSIPFSKAGLEPKKAIALATEQVPALPPHRLPPACDLSKVVTEQEMCELHYEIANLINQWCI